MIINNLFNESEYLDANPDVAAAVRENIFRSGRLLQTRVRQLAP